MSSTVGLASLNSSPFGRVKEASNSVSRFSIVTPAAYAAWNVVSRRLISSLTGLTLSTPVISKTASLDVVITLSCSVSLPIVRSPSRRLFVP